MGSTSLNDNFKIHRFQGALVPAFDQRRNMIVLENVEVSECCIREFGYDGHECLTIPLEDLSHIDFLYGLAPERPLLQIVTFLLLAPLSFWCIRLLAADISYRMPTGTLRPAVCLSLLSFSVVFGIQFFKALIPQPYLKVGTKTGPKKIRFGSGVSQYNLRIFYDEICQEVECPVLWLISE